MSFPIPRLRPTHAVPVVFALLASALVAGPCALAQDASSPGADEWLVVEYGELVDRRELAQSGEPIGALLTRLSTVTDPTGRAGLLDQLVPVVEPYAFVLGEALDSAATSAAAGPFVEVGRLWDAGAAQPAWVELFRSRRYVLESDGAGRMRAFVPYAAIDPAGETSLPTSSSVDLAEQAWTEHYGVVRHAIAAELRRRAASGAEAGTVELAVHPYRHVPAASAFVVGKTPFRASLSEAGPDGRRPPLDVEAWRRFLASGQRLEGARLSDGEIVLFGSETESAPSMIGASVSLSDLAVAYRAIRHGGRRRPFMSLDRSTRPHVSVVSHGGRLRDTMLGLVSLECDVRFKTMSQGLDPYTQSDERGRLAEAIPGFRTHVEEVAQDPTLRSIPRQQTRFWFYPDAVDLTLSVQGDVLVFRRARMTAASERLSGEDASVPPWTQRTIGSINREYEKLAELYPELASLDEVVRLLSLFTWLDQAARAGLNVPDLDTLLAVELPMLRTPRTFPQLLAFNALPEQGGPGRIDVLGRAPLGVALDRLDVVGPRLDARTAARRVLARLDPSRPAQTTVAQRLRAALDAPGTPAEVVDRLAYEAERVLLYDQLVVATLAESQRETLRARLSAGERPRVFALGIGGLDLGMSSALERARAQRVVLSWGEDASGAAVARASTPSRAAPSARPRAAGGERAPRTPRSEWKREPDGLPDTRLPEHAWPEAPESGRRTTTTQVDYGRLVLQRGSARDGLTWHHALHAPLSVDVTSRRVIASEGRLAAVERYENGRFLRYGFTAEDGRLRATASDTRLSDEAEAAALETLFDDGSRGARADEATDAAGSIAVLSVVRAEPDAPVVSVELGPAGGDRAQLEVARSTLRLVAFGAENRRLGATDLAPFIPPRGVLAQRPRLLVLADDSRLRPPWSDAPRASVPGEQSAAVLAETLSGWWADDPKRGVAVAVDASASPARWAAAPDAGAPRALLLPDEAFPAYRADLRRALSSAWGEAGPVLSELAGASPRIVVLASAESSGRFAERALALARDDRMKGAVLALMPLGAPVRADLPARLIEAGSLAGVGLAKYRPEAARTAAGSLATFVDGLTAEGAAGRGLETVEGPFVWYF